MMQVKRPNSQQTEALSRPGSRRNQDEYLWAARAASVPVAVHFIDGEVFAVARIKEIFIYTVVFTVNGEDHLVYKNALKRISPVNAIAR
jgi:sRNA-binding regulator protein Hfq